MKRIIVGVKKQDSELSSGVKRIVQLVDSTSLQLASALNPQTISVDVKKVSLAEEESVVSKEHEG